MNYTNRVGFTSMVHRPQKSIPRTVAVHRPAQPNLDMAHLDLGIIYSETGHKAEALRELKLAEKINPENVNVHWRLAQLYREMDRKEEAAAEFTKTKALTKAADESVSSRLKTSAPRKTTSSSGSPDVD